MIADIIWEAIVSLGVKGSAIYVCYMNILYYNVYLDILNNLSSGNDIRMSYIN